MQAYKAGDELACGEEMERSRARSYAARVLHRKRDVCLQVSMTKHVDGCG